MRLDRSLDSWSTSSSGTSRASTSPGSSACSESWETLTQELRAEGTAVRYLGSTIVPGDEACFCQFEGASEEAVAEANVRAGVPFARIVAAVAVPVASDSS